MKQHNIYQRMQLLFNGKNTLNSSTKVSDQQLSLRKMSPEQMFQRRSVKHLFLFPEAQIKK